MLILTFLLSLCNKFVCFFRLLTINKYKNLVFVYNRTSCRINEHRQCSFNVDNHVTYHVTWYCFFCLSFNGFLSAAQTDITTLILT